MVLIFLGLVYGMCRHLTDSHFGRALRAIREDELTSQSVGIDPVFYKTQAIVIGTACAGLAGALNAHFITFISPELLNPFESILLLVMLVIGGIGDLSGAFLGAFIMVFIPEYLRFAESYRMLLYGIVIIAFMIFLPRGLSGLIQRLYKN
jgi:branched-chain amino acid transport system permease protein